MLPPFFLSALKILTYLSSASLAYAVVLYLVRQRLHVSFTHLPPARQQRLVSLWRQLLILTRLSLVLLPAGFVPLLFLLPTYAGVSNSLTAPLFLLIYLNIVVIHLDRRWHASHVESNVESRIHTPAA
jgi:hypothetical protein